MLRSSFCAKASTRVLFVSHLYPYLFDRNHVGKIHFQVLHGNEFSLQLLLQWVSFWIKPEAAPARVTLGVTSLLTLSTQHAKSQASLPPVSYLKAVDAFMSVCTIFVFMALMEYCLVNIVLGE